MYDWKPYVPVAKRRQKAQKKMESLRKKGEDIQPIEIAGRKIAKTFWGKQWCDHMEQFNDFENRLPRGRTYARNGSVCHLKIQKGQVKAYVYGSELYKISVTIKTLNDTQWQAIKSSCAGEVGSLLELLEGRFSDHVMKRVTDPQQGLLPNRKEIKYRCSCPDWADMCKHVAAVLYGVGARLDHAPEQLFLLRGVDHHELIEVDLDNELGLGNMSDAPQVEGDLSSLFGIDLDSDASTPIEAPTNIKTRKVKAKAPASTEPTQSIVKKAAKITTKRTAPKPTETKKASIKKTVSKKTVAKKAALKKTAAKKTSTKKKGTTQHKSSEFKLTAAGVRRLRKQLEMNKRQFAQLVGVSSASISLWESSSGKLNLKAHTEAGLLAASQLSHQAAWQRVD